MKFERIRWNILKKGKGQKKIHFKKKMLSSFYFRCCIIAFSKFKFVCLPKIFCYFINNFMEKKGFMYFCTIRNQPVRNQPVNVTHGAIFICGPRVMLFLFLPTP